MAGAYGREVKQRLYMAMLNVKALVAYTLISEMRYNTQTVTQNLETRRKISWSCVLP